MALAVAFAVVWPASRASDVRDGVRYLLLRWGHSAVWVLLACSFIARSVGTRSSRRIASALAMAGLLTYVAFLSSLA